MLKELLRRLNMKSEINIVGLIVRISAVAAVVFTFAAFLGAGMWA